VLKQSTRCLILGLIIVAALSAADSPDPAEQQRMLDNIRQYTNRYLNNLPNFVCARVTEQYEAGKRPEHWKQRDTLTSRLVFNQGREDQTLELVNGKEIRPGHFVSRPLETEGEFGILIANVLDGETGAEISWSRWEDLRGSRLAVFEYVVDLKHSTLSLGLGGLGQQFVPYRGLIYADPASGEVSRITNAPFDIPDSLATKSITTTIDYGSVEIGNRHFVLPLSASILLDTGHNNILNKVAFRDYRKFEAESKITFLSGSN
jgi:hypothetical protein